MTEKPFKIGVGGAFISDLNTIGEARRNYRINGGDIGLFFNNVKGLSTSFSIPIFDHASFELRHVFPLEGEENFTARRSSISFKYQLIK